MARREDNGDGFDSGIKVHLFVGSRDRWSAKRRRTGTECSRISTSGEDLYAIHGADGEKEHAPKTNAYEEAPANGRMAWLTDSYGTGYRLIRF